MVRCTIRPSPLRSRAGYAPVVHPCEGRPGNLPPAPRTPATYFLAPRRAWRAALCARASRPQRCTPQRARHASRTETHRAPAGRQRGAPRLRLGGRARLAGAAGPLVERLALWQRHARALRRGPRPDGGRVAPPDPLLRRPHAAAHVDRVRLLAVLCHRRGLPGRQEPCRPRRHPARAGRAAVRAGAGLSVGHGGGLHGAVPGQPAGRGVRGHLCHLHRAGVEHGIRLLPLHGHHPE